MKKESLTLIKWLNLKNKTKFFLTHLHNLSLATFQPIYIPR
jgi:hypothetical protein